jgi:hypothetical protein
VVFEEIWRGRYQRELANVRKNLDEALRIGDSQQIRKAREALTFLQNYCRTNPTAL